MGKSRKVSRDTQSSRRLDQLPLGLTLLVAVLAPLIAGRFDYPPQAALSVLVVLAAVGAVVFRSPRKDTGTELPVLLLWGLAGWTAVTWLWSVYRHATELETARLLVVATWAALSARTCRNRPARELWLIAMCLGGAIAAWTGIAQYAATPDRSWRTFGTFYNPNELATCLGIGALCAAGLAFGSDRRPVRVFALTTAISCAAGLLLTGSRTGGLAFVMGALVFGIAMGKEMWRLTTPGARWACAGALVVILGIAGPPLVGRLLQGSSISHSQKFRVKTWAGTARMAAARPFTGFGGGAYEYAYPRFAQVGFTRMAHQVYLQFAAEQGLPGLLLFLAAVIAAMWPGRKSGPPDSFLAGTRAALIVVVVHGLADYGWQIPALALWTAGLIGALAAGQRVSRGGRIVPRVNAVGLTLTAAATVCLVLPEWVASRQAERGDEATSRGSLNVAAEHYVKAVAWSPRNEKMRLDYASLLEHIATRSDYGRDEVVNEAERHYRTAARLAPTHASCLRRVGGFYFRQDRYKEAVRWLEKATEEFPLYTTGFFELAEAQAETGDERAAEKSYERVLDIAQGPAGQLQAVPELAFDDAVVRSALRLAQLHHKRGDWRELLAVSDQGLQEMQDYRTSAAYARSLARASGVGGTLPADEANRMEAELNAYAAASQWQCGDREAFRKAVTAALDSYDDAVPILWTILPPEARAEVE